MSETEWDPNYYNGQGEHGGAMEYGVEYSGMNYGYAANSENSFINEHYPEATGGQETAYYPESGHAQSYNEYGNNYGEANSTASYGEEAYEAAGYGKEAYAQEDYGYFQSYGETDEAYGQNYAYEEYYGEEYCGEAHGSQEERGKAEREARKQAEREAREREVRERIEREARERAEQEAREREEIEKAAKEARENAAREQAQRQRAQTTTTSRATNGLPRAHTSPSISRGRGVAPVGRGRAMPRNNSGSGIPAIRGARDGAVGTGLGGGRGLGGVSGPQMRQQRAASTTQPSWLQQGQQYKPGETQSGILQRQGQYKPASRAGQGQNRMNRAVSAITVSTGQNSLSPRRPSETVEIGTFAAGVAARTGASGSGSGLAGGRGSGAGSRMASQSVVQKPTFQRSVTEPVLTRAGITQEELNSLPPFDDPNSYRLKLLLEDGQIVLQVVPRTATIDQVKQMLIDSTEHNLTVETKFQFKIPGAGFITNEHESLSSIPYIENAAKRTDDPRFMLVKRGGPYYKQIKDDEVKIGALLNRPIAWQQHDDENTAFRQCMARVRLRERRAALEDAGKIRVNIPVAIGDEVPTKKLFFTLVINKTMKKMVVGNEVETADEFLQRVWKYFPASKAGELPQDYALTAVGKAVYMAGPHRLYDIEYIQRCALSNTEIQLALIKRSEIDVRKEDSSYLFETEEDFLDTDPVIHYDHAILSSGKGVRGLKSVWDLKNAFEVTVKTIANIPVQQLSTKYQTVVYLHMTIMCGAEYLFGPTRTKEVALTGNSVSLNCTLLTNILLCDLPRESKIVFSLWMNTPTKKSSKPSCISWVNCLLYDYKNELRCGPQLLKMWPGNAEPMGTVVGKNDPSAAVLTIQFYEEGETIVLPTEPLDYRPYPAEPEPSSDEKKMLTQLINQHSLKNLSKSEKELIWKYRRSYCMQFPNALPKFCQSVPKTDRIAVQEMHKLLQEWAPLSPVDALELLDSRYADVYVRRYAISKIEKLTNAQIEDYLLQLVQVLKYECYHDSSLIRHLLKCAIRNKRIGHYLYWYLKSELQNPQVSERFGLLLEAFLKGGGNEDITAQEKVHQKIVSIAYQVKAHKGPDPVALLRGEIAKLNTEWPKGCQLMLDPLFITKGIKVEKCKMRPLWLLFENADPTGEDLNIIFKCGDDLRQDMLTLQMFRIMDKLWKKEGLDLMLNPYGVIATGGETGMIEVVTRSNTISKIQKQCAGAVGAFKDEVLFKWLSEKNPDEMSLKMAIENFTASCGGYCVATYVLGIGDRHNDNIMVKEDGHLFHIDFGHILGNFKKKFGFKRERVPFVFTPDWAYVMGGRSSPYYIRFVTQCMQAHQILRENSQLFINLLSMMIISGMPELSSKEDIMYVVDTLNVTTDTTKSNKSFQALLNSTGAQTSTRVNFFIHNLVH